MVTRELGGTYDRVAGYIWPGGDDALDYFTARTRADALARRVSILLQLLAATGATVDVMGHSMGCRVILKALKTQSTDIARNIFAMAASVDNESVEMGEEFYPSTERCDSFLVFHSKHDGVLKTAYRLAERDNALGLHGPENPDVILHHSSPAIPATPNVYVVNCKHRVHKHGDYKRTGPVYRYIGAFVAGTPTSQYVTL